MIGKLQSRVHEIRNRIGCSPSASVVMSSNIPHKHILIILYFLRMATWRRFHDFISSSYNCLVWQMFLSLAFFINYLSCSTPFPKMTVGTWGKRMGDISLIINNVMYQDSFGELLILITILYTYSLSYTSVFTFKDFWKKTFLTFNNIIIHLFLMSSRYQLTLLVLLIVFFRDNYNTVMFIVEYEFRPI